MCCVSGLVLLSLGNFSRGCTALRQSLKSATGFVLELFLRRPDRMKLRATIVHVDFKFLRSQIVSFFREFDCLFDCVYHPNLGDVTGGQKKVTKLEVPPISFEFFL